MNANANDFYNAKSVKELRKLAAGIVKGANRARKADLVSALSAHDAALNAHEAKASKANGTKSSPKARKANKGSKAPADAQTSTNPGMAKAQRFVAAAAGAGWTGRAFQMKDNPAMWVGTVSSGKGDQAEGFTLYWLNGVYQYGPSVFERPDHKPRKVLNTSAALRHMGAKK